MPACRPRMQLLAGVVCYLLATVNGQPSAYTVPGAFPTSLYSKYYNDPTATTAQPQPVISDPVTHKTFPFPLTDPNNIPQNNTVDPHPLPPTASPSQLLQQAITQIKSIASNAVFANNKCAGCQASLEVAKFLALAAPDQGPNLAVALCEYFNFSSSCVANYGPLALGPIFTQVLSYADVGGYDGELICSEFLRLCPLPTTSPLDLSGWFSKPKPNPLPPPKKPTGQRLKVLHLSDLHIDPRYANGAEANCTSGLCCRENAYNSHSPHAPILPAPRFGYFLCDSPYALIAAVLEAIPPLTGTETTGFNFTLLTGDLVAHDPDYQLSRAYNEYAEVVLFDLIKRMLGLGPVYATLGNHDSYPSDLAAPLSLDGDLGGQFSWLYDHVTALWEHQGWLPAAEVEYSRAHYAAYMIKRVDGLRIISLNTNLWYRANYFNYINASHPDTSGMMRFLTDELQLAEDAGDRAWIIGHVPSGWDGTNGLLNPTNLFYQIVDRYSPHVIANIFWGHMHEDEMSIFYAKNGTSSSAETAQTLSWMGPSLTPLTNLNAGFRMYEVDSGTFEVLDAYTWISSVDKYSALDSQSYGPSFDFEYSAREAYGRNIAWSANDPLNATWWHLVTEQMETNSSLVSDVWNKYQGKSSVLSPPCTGECVAARICYIRSGSSSIAQENCPKGYGSVQ